MDVDAMLAQCTIPTPCPMDWDRMSGDDRVRFCGRCGKHVYNLSAMSPDEAGSIIADVRELGEDRCVRMYRRPDGTLTASACRARPAGAAGPRQFTIRALMAVIAGAAGCLGLARWLAQAQEQPTQPPPPASSQPLMGCVAY